MTTVKQSLPLAVEIGRLLLEGIIALKSEENKTADRDEFGDQTRTAADDTPAQEQDAAGSVHP